MSLKIKKIVNGKWKENCYIVSNQHKEAILIDPGNAEELIREFVETEKLKMLGILNTHAHYDHIGAVANLKKQFSIPFYLDSKDEELLGHANLYREVFDEKALISIPSIDYFLDRLELPVVLGCFSIDVIPTPGHTRGGVCLLIEKHLFTGDTLFRNSIGHTKFPDADKGALCGSLKRLSQLNPELTIYPGHGGISTIKEALQNNKEFRASIDEN